MAKAHVIRAFFSTILFFAGRCVADTVNYTHDNAGRLVRVDYGSGTSIAYTYDPSGNLLNRAVTSASDGIAAGRKQDSSATAPSKTTPTVKGRGYAAKRKPAAEPR